MKITKIKLIPLLIGIVLLGLIPNVIAQTNQGFENYTNQNYQFQISIPQDWEISEEQKIGGFDITFTKPISETDCKVMFHVNIEDQPPNFDDFTDNHLGSLFTDISNLKISYSNYSTFINHESYTVQYSGIPHIAKPGCNNFTFSENYLIENDSGFVFRYMFEDSENSEIENQLQHMMNSITFDAEPVVETDAEPVVETDAEPVVETDAEPVVETDAEPEIPQTNYNVKIRFSISPSVVEAENKTHNIGYIQTIDSNGLPVSAPADLLIKLSSSDTDIAQVPKVVSLPIKEEIATFDITVNEIEGSSIITAEFQNQVLLQEILVGGEFVSEALQDVSLKIHMPSSKTLINSKIPFSVFLQSNGTALQAPKDISVTLDYQRNLINLQNDEVIIKKGTYYALSTFETLGNEGNAFLRAKTLQPALDAIENIKVTSTKPAELFVRILPEEIVHTEKSIDLFIGLLDVEGNPTLAPENISVNIFSDQAEFEKSINESIQPKGIIIKKGEFGYHLVHEYTFQTLPDNITITVGVSTAGLKVGTSTFELLRESLSAEDEKASKLVIEVFTVEKMPLGAKAIAVYQLRAIEEDFDDGSYEIELKIKELEADVVRTETDITSTQSKIESLLEAIVKASAVEGADISKLNDDLEDSYTQLNNLEVIQGLTSSRIVAENNRLEDTPNDHAIDDLDEGETYPVQSQSNYIQDNSFQSIGAISYDEDKITILDSGILSTTKSYGTMIIQSGQETGETEISAVLGGIGTGSATVEVLSSSSPESTKVFSPVGEKDLVFNSQGVIDIILLPMDNDGRPTISENSIEYLLKPTNDFLTVNPRENFAKTEIQSSSFGTDLARGNSTMIVIPIGVDAKTELEAELTFDLVPSSSTITPMFPFDMIAGVNKVNNGIVQLVDFFGNPVTVTDDLPVFLESLNSDVIEVPDNITIKAGNSYTTFPITVSTTEGTTNITATAQGFRDGNTNIDTKLFSNDLLIYIDSIQQPISFDEDVTVKIFVDDLNAKSIEGVTLTFSGDENLEISPSTAITDNTGLATITIKAIAGPETSLTVQAVKAGFTSDEVTKNLSVSGLAITDEFLGVPSWVMYAMIVAIIGAAGAGLFFFMKKPKEVKEEEEEEEEI